MRSKSYAIFIILIAVAALSIFAVGCKPRQTANNQPTITVKDANGQDVGIADSSRIVSCNTALTETIVALGAANRVVGVDVGSHNYMPEIASVPDVGNARALSPEGIISLKPTLVIINADAGPAELVAQLKGAGIPVLTLTATYSADTVKEKVRTIAKALGLDAKGEELVAGMDRDLSDAQTLLANAKEKPKVIFCGKGPNMPNATISGKKTTVDTMITLAGGVNPITQFEGFKPMTDEAVVAAAPDVILMTERSFERSGGAEGVLKFPGVALTPAGKNKRFIPVSDIYFQGFGPGMGKAVKELALKLHPELKP
jgi:iron complex transport system substrate-binding protein